MKLGTPDLILLNLIQDITYICYNTRIFALKTVQHPETKAMKLCLKLHILKQIKNSSLI